MFCDIIMLAEPSSFCLLCFVMFRSIWNREAGFKSLCVCDAVLLGQRFPVFWRIMVPSSSSVKLSGTGILIYTTMKIQNTHSLLLLDPWKINALLSFKYWKPLTQWHSITSEKTQILSNTTVRTSDLTLNWRIARAFISPLVWKW